MRPSPSPSASPLYSFCSRPDMIPAHRAPPSLADALRQILRWITGRERPRSLYELFREQRLIDAIAEELEAESSVTEPVAPDEFQQPKR